MHWINSIYFHLQFAKLNSKIVSVNSVITTTIGSWTVNYADMGNNLMYVHATRIVNTSVTATGTAVAMSGLPFSVAYPQRLSGIQHDAGVPIAPVYAFINGNAISWGHAGHSSASQFDIFGVVKVTD